MRRSDPERMLNYRWKTVMGVGAVMADWESSRPHSCHDNLGMGLNVSLVPDVEHS
ncbi:MAG: hypothetical protein M1318_01140 [Firmicutes bacterium]|nr:hypothetical protein [Bacillota bacterium]